MKNERLNDLHRGRQQIVRECAGKKAAVGRIGVFFIDGGPKRMGKAASDLPRDHTGVEDTTAIMRGDISVDA